VLKENLVSLVKLSFPKKGLYAQKDEEDYECEVKVFWEVLNFHSVLWYPEFHFIHREREKGK